MNKPLKNSIKLVAAVLLLGLIFTGSAYADNDTVPEAGDSAGTDSSNVMIEAAKSGSLIQLNAPSAWVLISFTDKTGSQAIRFNDGCLGGSADTYPAGGGGCDRSSADKAQFTLYRMKSDGSVDTSGPCTDGNFGGTIGSRDKAGGNYVLSDGWGPQIDVTNCVGAKDKTTGLYGVYVKSTIGPSNAINAFKVEGYADNGKVIAGYGDSDLRPNADAGLPTALQNRDTPAQDPRGTDPTKDNGNQNQFIIKMRQVCEPNIKHPYLELEWNDADAAPYGNPEDEGIGWKVKVTDQLGHAITKGALDSNGELTSAQAASLFGKSEAKFLGGSNDSENWTFNPGGVGANKAIPIQQGDKITWTWSSVRRTNGVQVFLHYNNNFFNDTKQSDNCNPNPPKGSVVEAFCSAKTGKHENDVLVKAHDPDFGFNGDTKGGQPVNVTIYGKVYSGSVPSNPHLLNPDTNKATYDNPGSPNSSFKIGASQLANQAVPSVYKAADNDSYKDWFDYNGSAWQQFVSDNSGKKVDILLQAQDLNDGNWYTVDQYIFDDNCGNVPSGTIDCDSDTFEITTTTSIKDKDHAGPYQVLLYEGDANQQNFQPKAGAIAGGKTDSSGDLDIDVSGLMGGKTHSFYVYIYGVDASGAKDTKDGQTNVTTCEVPPTGNCPGDQAISNDPEVQVDLPDGSPEDNGEPAPVTLPASSPAPSAYTQTIREDKTDNIKVSDISEPLDSPRVILEHSKDGYETTTLDYSKYVDNFPYDHNQPEVTYDSHYKKQTWNASGGAPYCSAGSGPDCSYPIYTYEEVGTYTVTNDDGSTTTYPSYAWVQTGTGHGILLVDYTWSKSGGTSEEKVTSTTDDTYQMEQCWYRTVNVSATMQPGTLNPDQQDPTQADFATRVTVVFGPADGGPSAQLRNPMSLDLTDSELGHDTLGVDSDISCDSDTGGSFTIDGPGGGPPYNFGSNSYDYTTSCYGRAGTLAGPLHLDPGDEICAETDVQPSEGTLNDTIDDSPDLGPSGTDGQTSATNCSDAVNDWPYTQFFGNDVTTGGAFDGFGKITDNNDNNCTTAAGAAGSPVAAGNIEAFVNGSGTLSRGSGTQFAALSEGQGGTVSQFSSALLRNDTGSLPNNDTGLTFANADAGGTPAVGSLMTQHCVPDYFRKKPAVTGTNYVDSNWGGGSLTNLANGVYLANHNITIDASTLGAAADSTDIKPHGQSIAIYVQGNVTINGDITYKTSGRKAIYVNGVLKTNIPSLFIIAMGNIDINPGVREVDGNYVAQNYQDTFTPTKQHGGVINTCSTGSGDLFTTCNHQLVIRGAFIANKVELYRTFGSVRDSAIGEYPGIPANSADITGCNTGDDAGDQMRDDLSIDCGAEIFEFSPEMFLGKPAIPAIPTNYKFDAISSLSPVL